MAEAITTAKGELDNPGDGHDRSDADSPDFIVFISDGQQAQGPVIAAADAAKVAGVEIFVVGVDAGSSADYLQNQVASKPTNYFDISQYGQLKATLESLATCG